MYTLTLNATLQKHGEKPQETAISVGGADIEDVRLIMSTEGPNTAFFNSISRLLSEAEMRERQQPPVPAAPQEDKDGVGAAPPAKKKKGKTPAAGPAVPVVVPVPGVDGSAPVPPGTP